MLADLNIEPLDFTNAIGQNIFDDFFEGDVVDGYSSDSDSDSKSMWSAHWYGV